MTGFGKRLMVLVCLGFVGTTARADRRVMPVRTSAAGVVDVSLTSTHELSGRFLNGEGDAVAGAVVVLSQGERTLDSSTTDQTGSYCFHEVQTGVYCVAVGDQRQLVRAWEPTLSPPAARPQLTLVQREPVVRGQWNDSVAGRLGLVVGVGGAIAAGFAVADSQNAREETKELRRLLKLAGPASP